MRPGESFPNGIDIESANKLFGQDIADAENAVRHYVKVPLNQNQYDALVSLAYNMGGPHFGSTDVVKHLNRGDYAGAASQFGSLINAKQSDGSYAAQPGLTPRRKEEADLFAKPPGN